MKKIDKMPSNAINMFVILQFLESAKRKACGAHEKDYEKCIENKSNRFETCYILHMEKFYNCMKSSIELEK